MILTAKFWNIFGEMVAPHILKEKDMTFFVENFEGLVCPSNISKLICVLGYGSSCVQNRFSLIHSLAVEFDSNNLQEITPKIELFMMKFGIFRECDDLPEALRRFISEINLPLYKLLYLESYDLYQREMITILNIFDFYQYDEIFDILTRFFKTGNLDSASEGDFSANISALIRKNACIFNSMSSRCVTILDAAERGHILCVWPHVHEFKPNHFFIAVSSGDTNFVEKFLLQNTGKKGLKGFVDHMILFYSRDYYYPEQINILSSINIDMMKLLRKYGLFNVPYAPLDTAIYDPLSGFKFLETTVMLNIIKNNKEILNYMVSENLVTEEYIDNYRRYLT